ncbi:VOC family protein [Paenibacillus periandrae]|uniref:VOC family protein n=1 Tax=Paenibacillus periandrae TaxID=1761741 RepID=UPI001F08F21E|nr:VOC family protein [Paenibacillus periandrae]
MEQISNNRIIKLGVVVDNLEEAFQYYVELFKLDPTKMRAPRPRPTASELSQAPAAAAAPEGGNTPYVWYRGEYRNARCRTAIIPLEPIYLELIEPYDELSPWTEFREKHGPGIHFMTFHIDGFDEHIELMESKGMPAFHKQEKGKERYAYFDSVAKLGATIEFKEIDKN